MGSYPRRIKVEKQRGNTNLRDLDDLIRGNDVESLISTNERLTLAEIRAIRSNRSLPGGYNLV